MNSLIDAFIGSDQHKPILDILQKYQSSTSNPEVLQLIAEIRKALGSPSGKQTLHG